MAVTVPCKEGESILSENNFDFTVYPNPNPGEFSVTFFDKPDAPVQIKMTDMMGKIVNRLEVNEQTIIVTKTNVAEGIYFLSVQNADRVVIKKINILK